MIYFLCSTSFHFNSLATLGGNIDVAKVLLENGADVNMHDKQGKNVLMVYHSHNYRVIK